MWVTFDPARVMSLGARLSTAELGALFILMADYLTSGPIPLKSAKKIVRFSEKKWREFLENAGNLIEVRGDLLVVAEADELRKEAEERMEAARAKARKAAAARWNRELSTGKTDTRDECSSNAGALHEQCMADANKEVNKEKKERKEEREIESARAYPARNSPAGAVAGMMREAGASGVNPAHPVFVELLASNVPVEVFVATTKECVERGKTDFRYIVGTIRSRMTERKGPRAETIIDANRAAVDVWLNGGARQ